MDKSTRRYSDCLHGIAAYVLKLARVGVRNEGRVRTLGVDSRVMSEQTSRAVYVDALLATLTRPIPAMYSELYSAMYLMPSGNCPAAFTVVVRASHCRR